LQDGARGHVRRWRSIVCAALAPMWFDLTVTKDACVILSISLTDAQVHWHGNGHYYQYVPRIVDFNSALTSAASASYLGRQGHLVTITSAEENKFVIDLAAANSFWIAGSDAHQEGVWRWIAGPELGQLIHVTFLAARQSDDYRDEDYLGFAVSYGWNDFQLPGNIVTKYVIEYECPSDPSASQYCSRKSACLSYPCSFLILILHWFLHNSHDV
jgi:hypothetical protein